VADPNPRAQAFHSKYGFVADGRAQVEGGVREIRMVRGMQHPVRGRGSPLASWPGWPSAAGRAGRTQVAGELTLLTAFVELDLREKR